MQSSISWFSIHAQDFERAVCFYETVMGYALQREEINGRPMAIFPGDPEAPGGAICASTEANPPGPMGTVVSLFGGEDLNVPLARVEGAGGTVLVPKTLIREDIGHYALFRDSEGNHVGLYSMN